MSINYPLFLFMEKVLVARKGFYAYVLLKAPI